MTREKEIYIDITNMLSQPFVSGIQRVVREGTKCMLRDKKWQGWRVFLLQWVKEKRAYQRLDNQKYLLWLRGELSREQIADGQMILPEQIPSGAVFFDIDSVWPNEPHRAYLFSVLKHRGVRIVAFIHDILPITHPQYSPMGLYTEFPHYLDAELAYADIVFTTTQFVADEVEKLIVKMRHQRPCFAVAPLGSDFNLCLKSDPRIDPQVKEIAQSAPYLLTVSTIEPRKNHTVILDAYDQFLKKTNMNIIFAGREGWNVEQFMKRLRTHPHFNKRIFHLEGKNDETISYLYQKALYTVFPTYGEGFGIPAVESLIAGTPALLSDIPVLHEIAGDYAEYFAPDSPEQLARLVSAGLADPEAYSAKRKALKQYRPTTWKDFGESLADGMLLLDNANSMNTL